jgi:hypothetical protein
MLGSNSRATTKIRHSARWVKLVSANLGTNSEIAESSRWD